MALVKCLECGKELSSDAKACPHCGAPKLSSIGKSTGMINFTRIYGFLLIILGIWLYAAVSDSGFYVIIIGLALMIMKINKRE